MHVEHVDLDHVLVTRVCPVCRKLAQVQVETKGYQEWIEGKLIQNALPTVPKDLREILITGIHPSCWETAFGGEEE